MQTVRAGSNWSDPTIWDLGRVPTATDDPLVLHSLTLDRAISRHTHIHDGAVVTFAQGGTWDSYGSIKVCCSGSQLKSSVPCNINFHVPDDRQFLGNALPGTPNPPGEPMEEGDPNIMVDYLPTTDIGLWVVNGGIVSLVGPQVTPWLEVDPGISIGNPDAYGVQLQSGITTLSAALSSIPVGWQVGDQLLLVSVDHGYALATLASINGPGITFANVTWTGSGAFSANAFSGPGGRYLFPIVANLTRRIQIIASDVTASQPYHRSHLCVMMGGSAQLDGVEIRNFGVRGKLGRYPCHFHKLADTGSGNYIRRSTVWSAIQDAGSRAIVVHSTNNAQVTDNVAFRVQGHAVFIEGDLASGVGTEHGSTITGNLVVDVRQRHYPADVSGSMEEIPVAEHDRDGLSWPYWIRRDNTIANNIYAGGTPADCAGLNSVVSPDSPVEPAAVGMFVLTDAATGQPNVPLVNGFKCYNTNSQVTGIDGGNGGWAVGGDASGVVIQDLTVAFCSGGHRDRGTIDDWHFTGELRLWYSPHFMYGVTRREVVDKIFSVNELAFATQYHSSVNVLDGEIYATQLVSMNQLDVVYFLQLSKLRLVDVVDPTLGPIPASLANPFGPRVGYVPGLLRLVCPDIQVSGAQHNEVSADYCHLWAPDVPPLSGIPAPFGYIASDGAGGYTQLTGGIKKLNARCPAGNYQGSSLGTTGFINFDHVPVPNTETPVHRVAGMGFRPLGYRLEQPNFPTDWGNGGNDGFWTGEQSPAEDYNLWLAATTTVFGGLNEGYPAAPGGTQYDVECADNLGAFPNDPWLFRQIRRVTVLPGQVVNWSSGQVVT